MWLLLGEVAGEAQVGDANMTVLVQQDISWLKERREGERESESDTDDGEAAEITSRALETMKETSLIRNSIYNFRFAGDKQTNNTDNPACFRTIRGNLLSWLSSQKR